MSGKHAVASELDECASGPGPVPPPTGMTTKSCRRGEVLVLMPQGVLEGETLRDLERILAAATAPVIIDLNECILTSVEPIRLLDARRWRRTSTTLCIACRRLSARRLLYAAGVNRRLALFRGVEDALQARVLCASGFGPGWDVEHRRPG